MPRNKNRKMSVWSEWRSFPDPGKGGVLIAPIGAGVYELRNKDTKALVLCGISKHTAKRMTSLLPQGVGSGTRKNSKKRCYVWENLQSIEYRTLATTTQDEALSTERHLLASRNYIYPT